MAETADNAHRFIASDARTRSKALISLHIYQYEKVLMPLQKQVADRQGFEPNKFIYIYYSFNMKYMEKRN